jgi:cytochrome c556
MLRRTIIVFALCAASAVSAAEDEQFVVVPNPALPGEVPAGSRADQILWRDARDAMVEGNETIKSAGMAAYDLRYAYLDLDQLEKDAKPGDAERLGAIRARLDGPAKALEAATPRGPVGGCRYSLLHFEQSMGADPSDEMGRRLPQKRAEAQKCRDDFRHVLATLGPAVKDVRKAIEEVGPEIRERMAARSLKTARPAKEAGNGAAKAPAANPDAAPGKVSP